MRSGMFPPARAGWLLTIALAVPPAQAQVPGCVIEDAGPNLRVYQCQESLRIAAEKSAVVSGLQRDGRLVAVRIESGAAYVDTGPRASGLRIETPHAEVETFGRAFALDVESARTSVFVRTGAVAVRQGAREVKLRDGEGVDVGPAPSLLDVKRWSPERATKLLGRLGQR